MTDVPAGSGALVSSGTDPRDFVAEDVFAYEHSPAGGAAAAGGPHSEYYRPLALPYGLDLFDAPASLRLIAGNGVYNQGDSPHCVAAAGAVTIEWQLRRLYQLEAPPPPGSKSAVDAPGGGRADEHRESHARGPVIVTVSQAYIYDHRLAVGGAAGGGGGEAAVAQGMTARQCMKVLARGVPLDDVYQRASSARLDHDRVARFRERTVTYLDAVSDLEVPSEHEDARQSVAAVAALDASTGRLLGTVASARASVDLEVEQGVRAVYAGSMYARVATVRGLQESLVTNGPCLIVLPLYPSAPGTTATERTQFWRPPPSSAAASSSPAPVGHALSVVGYDDRQRAFLLRNSWGPDWADKGHCWLSYDEFHVAWEVWTLFYQGKQLLRYYAAHKAGTLPPRPKPVPSPPVTQPRSESLAAQPTAQPQPDSKTKESGSPGTDGPADDKAGARKTPQRVQEILLDGSDSADDYDGGGGGRGQQIPGREPQRPAPGRGARRKVAAAAASTTTTAPAAVMRSTEWRAPIRFAPRPIGAGHHSQPPQASVGAAPTRLSLSRTQAAAPAVFADTAAGSKPAPRPAGPAAPPSKGSSRVAAPTAAAAAGPSVRVINAVTSPPAPPSVVIQRPVVTDEAIPLQAPPRPGPPTVPAAAPAPKRNRGFAFL